MSGVHVNNREARAAEEEMVRVSRESFSTDEVRVDEGEPGHTEPRMPGGDWFSL